MKRVLLFFCIAAIPLIYFIKEDRKNNLHFSNLENNSEPEKITSTESLVNLNQPSIDITPYEKPIDVKEAIDQFIAYEEKLGYFSDEDIDLYKTYEIASLIQLSEEGDMLASQVLGEIFSWQREYDNANRFFWKAATQGSIHALENMRAIKHVEFQSAQHESNTVNMELTKAHIYAWSVIIQRRGKDTLESDLIIFENQGLTFSEEDIKNGLSLADDYYQRMNQERNHLGLGDFSIEAPPDLEIIKTVQGISNTFL